MSDLVRHAERELQAAKTEGPVADTVLAMQQAHSRQGHSGASAGIFRGLFKAALEESDPLAKFVEQGYDPDGPEDPDKWIPEAILEVLKILNEASLSGEDKDKTAETFLLVAAFKPLVPLQGTDDEWNFLDYDDRTMYQNNRCSHVFKDKAGRAYDIDGKVFREPDGSCWGGGRHGNTDVKFPYTPVTEYVDVDNVDEYLKRFYGE